MNNCHDRACIDNYKGFGLVKLHRGGLVNWHLPHGNSGFGLWVVTGWFYSMGKESLCGGYPLLLGYQHRYSIHAHNDNMGMSRIVKVADSTDSRLVCDEQDLPYMVAPPEVRLG